MRTASEALAAGLAHPPANESAEVLAQLGAKGLQAEPYAQGDDGVHIAWRIQSAQGPVYVVDALARYFGTHLYVLSRTPVLADAMTRNAPLSLVVGAAAAYLEGPKQARSLGVGMFGIWPRDPFDGTAVGM